MAAIPSGNSRATDSATTTFPRWMARQKIAPGEPSAVTNICSQSRVGYVEHLQVAERSTLKAAVTLVGVEVRERQGVVQRQRLEYDHIIPLSKGGSNTARNIELRCEPCNRRKGARV